MSKPPVTYPVTLADPTTVADAAAELDGMRMFFVDQPSEQERIARIVAALHSIAERAAAHDAVLIYGPDTQDETSQEQQT